MYDFGIIAMTLFYGGILYLIYILENTSKINVNVSSNRDSVSEQNSDIVFKEDIILYQYIVTQQFFSIENNKSKLLMLLSGDMMTPEFLLWLIKQDIYYVVEKDDIVTRYSIRDTYNSHLREKYELKVQECQEYCHPTELFDLESDINLILIGEVDGKKYFSSLRQMNFYKWFIDSGLYDYVFCSFDELNIKFLENE